jgi:precorrin-3B methylase
MSMLGRDSVTERLREILKLIRIDSAPLVLVNLHEMMFKHRQLSRRELNSNADGNFIDSFLVVIVNFSQTVRTKLWVLVVRHEAKATVQALAIPV